MSRPQFGPTNVFLPGNDDMSGNLISEVTITQKISMLSYGISWAGSSPVGVISVECSNDYEAYPDGQIRNPGTWNTVPFTDSSGTLVTSFNVSGNTGKGFIDIDRSAAYAFRIVYTAGSGTGTIAASVAGKVA